MRILVAKDMDGMRCAVAAALESEDHEMVEKGLAITGGSAGHHRSERLDLTRRGRALLDEDPLLAVDANLKRLAPDDLFLLSNVLGRIIATLHPRDEETGAPGLEAVFDDADDVRR
ncbi:hypothetical protein [Pinisolibacter aquiterrae]|uniref:hypothetical protein n=1 Tax=Pinisolibacter aquiterrae TaxID=2815579 RepID=UPI001C3DA699|nr:hypothetical protein [Pinisolibacter aquiterrae]MBV5264577.1 hypothetical protein [Pinisolibacter aquiterrae]MCC8233346.1 hypothetical protein [Pinisolibacter aquiterrae]